MFTQLFYDFYGSRLLAPLCRAGIHYWRYEQLDAKTDARGCGRPGCGIVQERRRLFGLQRASEHRWRPFVDREDGP